MTRPRPRLRPGWCACVVGVLVVGACSGSDATPPTTTEASDVEAVPADPGGDGMLRIGVVLPLTGPGSELGTVMLEAIEFAQRESSPLGVQGQPVEIVPVDESTLEGTIPSFETMFTGEIDAVIGPGSSLVAERMLPMLVDEGVLTCSPTASALSLDAFPDTGRLFIRTIPSDSLQAKALARQLDGTGTPIVLAYVEDGYGGPFVELVRRELSSLGAPSPQLVGFDPTESDYTRVAGSIVASGAGTIGIIGDPEAGPRLLQSLAEVIDTEAQTSIWMNDAMRVPNTASIYRRLDADVLAIMRGVSPRSSLDAVPTARFPEGGRLFGANAYDCFNVIALTAEQAIDIDGAEMADLVVATTSGGTQCNSYPSCVQQLGAGRGFDYDGPTGVLDIGADGDVQVGVFDTYRFEDGLDVTDVEGAQRVTR